MSNRAYKVFIVDDDPSSRLVSSFCFKSAEFEVVQLESGEACLAALDQVPDIVLLDIEMPGLDGVTTCKAIREAGLMSTQVIFVSVRNDLETRLRAYDAGGNDYIVKPVLPDELEPKVAVAKHVLEQQRELEERVEQASSIAFSAMSSAAELGTVLHFLQSSFASHSVAGLNAALADALNQYGVEYILELRAGGESVCFSGQGAATQLEKSILEHVRLMDRIFQFHDRMVINYPSITLLVHGLPIEDETRLGRMRDNLALLVEGADSRLKALSGQVLLSRQARGIGDAAIRLSAALEVIEQEQATLRLNALCVMDTFIAELERSFVHLGLSERQEALLSDMARKAAAQVGGVLSQGRTTTDHLHEVGQSLRHLHAEH
ncbi:response regulator [Zoogloea dura]|jgi:CheY-like chemotaxis protein|uniref:Response regulator n=1 Tax=Zoogloea dura TaxID=2728840 RepID=A0A848G4E7_9RHOO|nr:response regulator transcription factor [Zoogloea dura]NML26124.1 response regulator [Zoogloea dura]